MLELYSFVLLFHEENSTFKKSLPLSMFAFLMVYRFKSFPSLGLSARWCRGSQHSRDSRNRLTSSHLTTEENEVATHWCSNKNSKVLHYGVSSLTITQVTPWTREQWNRNVGQNVSTSLKSSAMENTPATFYVASLCLDVHDHWPEHPLESEQAKLHASRVPCEIQAPCQGGTRSC